MDLSLSNIFFHCFASSGAGARRKAGVVEKDWANVLPDSIYEPWRYPACRGDKVLSLPQKKAVLVNPRTCATRRPEPISSV